MKKLLSLILCVSMLLVCTAGAAEAPVCIDFADGQYAFLGVDTRPGNADASALSVVDINGGKALYVDVKANVPYISINAEGLLGENYTKLASMTFTIGVENGTDGKFYAQSGKVYTITGTDEVKTGYDWSVYLKSKNPKKAVVTFSPDITLTAGIGEYLLITKETDTFLESGKFEGDEPRDFYITNLQFFDAQGNALPLDLSAVWELPVEAFDMTNMSLLTAPVAIADFYAEGDAWSQAGVSMPEEFRAALVPGSVLEVSFESETGDIWLVFPDSAKGWTRVEMQTATTNTIGTMAQFTYEEIAAVLGEDTATWGDRIQLESDGAWKAFSVKAGQSSARPAVTGATEFAGFVCSGGAWSQVGFSFTQEILDALQPGTALEIEFESAGNDMWIVLPDAAKGWTRVQMQAAPVVGDKAYITYEQIVAAVGEDKTGWGTRLQCESSGDWNVFAIRAGKLNQLMGVTDLVAFPEFSVSGGAWSQNGLEMPAEITAALVPGAVVTISYESETDEMWLVFPDSAKGWTRVEMQSADTDGKIAQVTFEEIAAALGDDVSAWGARLQCESSGAYTVYGVTVGQAH